MIEPSSASQAVAQALIAAGVPTEVSSNVRGALWAKLVLNCVYNAVSAITQLPHGRAVAGEGVKDVTRDVVVECLAVAHAVPGVHHAVVAVGLLANAGTTWLRAHIPIRFGTA